MITISGEGNNSVDTRIWLKVIFLLSVKMVIWQKYASCNYDREKNIFVSKITLSLKEQPSNILDKRRKIYREGKFYMSVLILLKSPKCMVYICLLTIKESY